MTFQLLGSDSCVGSQLLSCLPWGQDIHLEDPQKPWWSVGPRLRHPAAPKGEGKQKHPHRRRRRKRSERKASKTSSRPPPRARKKMAPRRRARAPPAWTGQMGASSSHPRATPCSFQAQPTKHRDVNGMMTSWRRRPNGRQRPSWWQVSAPAVAARTKANQNPKTSQQPQTSKHQNFN